MSDCYKNCEDILNGVCPPMKTFCPRKLAEHDKQVKAEVIEPIQKFIDYYDGAIIISDSLGVMSGQSIIDELKEIIKEQLKGV